jgi:hypothetical protein
MVAEVATTGLVAWVKSAARRSLNCVVDAPARSGTGSAEPESCLRSSKGLLLAAKCPMCEEKGVLKECCSGPRQLLPAICAEAAAGPELFLLVHGTMPEDAAAKGR